VVLAAAAACAGHYERGEKLYRQGDVPGAIAEWRAVQPGDRDFERTAPRLKAVDEEFRRLLRRYQKRAEFYRQQERLAEAVLYYRLALELEPNQPEVLALVQELVRQQERQVAETRAALEAALAENRLVDAGRHAERLGRLDPFDPAVQVDLRQVRAAVGAEVLRHLEVGKQAYGLGDRAGAERAFQHVLELQPGEETAMGYLAYIRRFEELEGQQAAQAKGAQGQGAAQAASASPPAPSSVSAEDIVAEGHYRSAQQAEQAGDPLRAIQEYLAALRVSPKHAAARRRLASLRQELQPRVEELYETGKRYFQDEDLQNALKTWRQVLLIDPAHERTLENVERAERMLSRLEEIQTGGS
jgi:tetratricopeptide (TPR) repeat protein